MARDPAALEAAIGDLGDRLAGHRGDGGGLDAPGAALAGIRAEIERRQRALEQARDHRLDRVAIPQHAIAVLGLHLFDLGRQRRVIGLEIDRLAPLDFGGVRCGLPDRRPVEGRARHEFGRGLARIERDAGRVAVEVDDEARELRLDDGRRERCGEPVELAHMPVGILDQLSACVELRRDLRRNAGAGMRHREDQRGRTPRDRDDLGAHALHSAKLSRPAALPTAPESTNSVAAARSGAR